MHHCYERGSMPLLAISALALGPVVAYATGFALLEQSASRLGTAFAGTAAAADDATTNYYNPAGLVELHGPEAIVVASGVGIQSRFHDRLSQLAPSRSVARRRRGG
jgi:long-chain fatty acid transport protein